MAIGHPLAEATLRQADPIAERRSLRKRNWDANDNSMSALPASRRAVARLKVEIGLASRTASISAPNRPSI